MIDRLLRPVPALLAAAALAAVLVPAVCLAPTETEPNDDPADGAYAGDIALGNGVLVIDGALADEEDLDVFRLGGVEAGSAFAVVDGFTGSLSLQMSHNPPHPNDAFDALRGWDRRTVFDWDLFAPAEERDHFAAVSFSQSGSSQPYRLRVVHPAPPITRAKVIAVFKDAPASDSLKAKLRLETPGGVNPGDGDVEVIFRDWNLVIPASEFQSNGAGTAWKWTSSTPPVKGRIAWNTKKGSLSIKLKGLDFGVDPEDGEMPLAVITSTGGCGTEFQAAAKVGRRSTKLTGKR